MSGNIDELKIGVLHHFSYWCHFNFQNAVFLVLLRLQCWHHLVNTEIAKLPIKFTARFSTFMVHPHVRMPTIHTV